MQISRITIFLRSLEQVSESRIKKNEFIKKYINIFCYDFAKLR